MRRRARGGFTLLEVVLAVTLALVLMAAMLTFYRQATHVREAVLEETRIVGGHRLVMDRLTDDLRTAIAHPSFGLGLEGGTGSLRLATTTLPGANAWVVPSMGQRESVPAEPDVQVVGYRLRVTETETGEWVVDGIERTCQRTPTAIVSEEGAEIQAVLMTPALKFLRLRYWDGNAWVESWGGGDLPGAVEVALGQEPLPEGVEPFDYPYPTLHRVVAVPGGVRATGGTMVRGLGEEGRP